MELNQLRAFLAVIDSGSLLSGAKLLQVSRSTLHTRIAALEESLQLELLVRTHRGVQPTEFGRHFAGRARALLSEADALAKLALRERDEVLGELRLRFSIGIPPKLHTIFPTLFHRRYPHINLRVEIANDPTHNVPEDVDLVMHFGPRVPSGPFRTFVLARFQERLLAHRSYLDAHGRPTQLAELSQHRLLCWTAPEETGHSLPLIGGGEYRVHPAYTTNDPVVLHMMASEGHGIVFVPDANSPNNPNARDEVEVVLPQVVGRESSVSVLVLESQASTPRSRAAVRALRELVKELQTMKMKGKAGNPDAHDHASS